MKKFLLILLLVTALFNANAQTETSDCEYTVENTEDGGELKTTREYLMYEKVFGGSAQFMFFSLTNSGGTPLLNFQLLAKSKDFPKLYCLDKNSKIYVQLTNGKVVTFISATEESCAGLIYDSAEKNNIRVLSGTFLFTKGSIEDLESAGITFIRVKYSTETVDYPIRSQINSETMKREYFPEVFFKNYLKCLK
jgi:hypothetical protein